MSKIKAGKIVVDHVCESGCEGSGIYAGFAEPSGVGVICFGCNGTGKQTTVFRSFNKRKTRRDIKTVHRSAGTFILTGVGPTGGSVTYKEFLKGKMPK